MLVYYFVPFIVSNLYLLFWVSDAHNSVTVENRTHVYMDFLDHKDLGNHLLQLCPKVVKHPVFVQHICTDTLIPHTLIQMNIEAGWGFFPTTPNNDVRSTTSLSPVLAVPSGFSIPIHTRTTAARLEIRKAESVGYVEFRVSCVLRGNSAEFRLRLREVGNSSSETAVVTWRYRFHYNNSIIWR